MRLSVLTHPLGVTPDLVAHSASIGRGTVLLVRALVVCLHIVDDEAEEDCLEQNCTFCSVS